MTIVPNYLSRNERISRKLPQHIAALCATMGGFIMGISLGWTSPVQPKLAKEYFPVTSLQNDMIGGAVSFGGMFGALIQPPLNKRIGLKGGMMFLALPASVGWALLIWAKKVEMIISGRFILGAVAGGMTVTCPIYTAEIAESDIRGTLGLYFTLQIACGIFFDYIVGNVVSILWFNVICAAFPILLALLMAFLPESPLYYLTKKNVQAAVKSLKWLRGKNYDPSEEIESMKATVQKVEEEQLSIIEAFSTTQAKLGILISIGLMFFQQFSGINGVIFYSSNIFSNADGNLSSETSSIITGGVSIIPTYLSSLLIDRLGRKRLLIISNSLAAISSAVLGLYFYLKETNSDVSKIGWLPITSVSIFIITYSLGAGPIPWLVVGEILPPSIKGLGSSIASVSNWLFSFIVTFSFSPVTKIIHNSFTFWFFAIVSALGVIFARFVIPETKGKSLGEIQRSLGGVPSTDENS